MRPSRKSDHHTLMSLPQEDADGVITIPAAHCSEASGGFIWRQLALTSCVCTSSFASI